MVALWEDLLKSALLGTERQRPPPPADGGVTSATLWRLSTAQPDAALLGAAAVVSTCRRAGFVPPLDESVRSLPAAAADDVPQASARSAQHLRVILAERRELLPEWAAAAAAAGRRAPDVMLPQLLELARTNRGHRDAVLPVLGQRGRWLAAQRPEWSFAATPGGAAGLGADAGEVEADWQTAERGARLTLLANLRQTNPARARLLLEMTWAEESADDRARFVATFAAGLSPSDEPFLENALDDRGKEVRRTAAGLLARLPSSQLVRRMTDRAVPLLAWKPGKKPKVEVTLPKALEKDAERDGVEPKPQHGRVGQKQWWLWQFIASVPPATWSNQWGVEPREIVEVIRKSEFEHVLLAAWAQAAARHGDAAWAEALIVYHAGAIIEHAGETVAAELRLAVPKCRRDALIQELLDAGATSRADDEPPALTLLRGADGAWDEKLARAVIDRIRAMAGRPQNAAYWKTVELLREMARRVPPAMLDELAKGWPEQDKAWERWKGAVDEFLATVQFRKDMLEEVRR